MAKKSTPQDQQPEEQAPAEQLPGEQERPSDELAAATTPPPDAPRPPQGITPRLSGKFHTRFKTVELVEPDSLRVPKKRLDGEAYFDDPYLALPNGKGGFAISQVSADHAALMLSCHPDSGAPPTVRLATDAEVEAHLKVNGPGGHGNLIGRR